MSAGMARPAHEPKWITEEMLFAIHAQQIERYGGMHGVVDDNVVHSALVRPINKWAYDEAADLADFAAMYLVAFAGSQGFSDGNKRTGLACALVFLAVNGASIDFEPNSLFEMVMAVANSRISDVQVAEYFR